ncbi:MAG: alginate export family protein [Planctomycetes bacterium]|nr:alginate export family protein [Planctomycetota bacterium]
MLRRMVAAPLLRLGSVSVLCAWVAAQEPTTDVRQELQRVLEEVRSLRSEMERKDRRIDELEGRFRELEQRPVPSSAPEQESVEKALEELRAQLAAMPQVKTAAPFPKVTLGGQLRWRAESRNGYDFGSGTAIPSNHFVEQRARLHADVDFSELLRAFVQIQDTRLWGEEVNTVDDSADGGDFHQAFLDFKKLFDAEDTLRIGRQEISYGAQRLVSALEWTNQARAFDGARWMGELGAAHAEVFATQLATARDAAGDVSGSEFGGTYWTLHPIEDAKKDALDLYLLYLHDAERYQGQERGTAGARYEILTKGGLYFEAEGALQFGNATTGTAGAPERSLDIPFGEVFAYVVRAGYRMDEADWKPGITFEWNHASGDEDPADGTNERFNTLFPLAHAHNGMIDLTFWENTRNAALRFNASPSDQLDLFLDGWWFWVDEDADAVRGPNFNIPGLAGSANFVGTEIDALARWRPTAGLSLEAGYAVLFPGEHVKDVLGDDELAHFVYVMLGLKF